MLPVHILANHVDRLMGRVLHRPAVVARVTIIARVRLVRMISRRRHLSLQCVRGAVPAVPRDLQLLRWP